jgi:hypothetical protein
MDMTRDARMKSNKDGHNAWVNLLHSVYGDANAPLRGCRGYNGPDKVKSFKDYIARMCKENALMPKELQYPSLLIEADALEKLSSKKELSKIAVSAKKQMAQDFTSIEVKLGLLESGVGSSNEAPVIIDDTPLPTVRDRKRQRAQMMCGNGNIIGDSAKLVDKVDECFGFIKDQFRGKENEKNDMDLAYGKKKKQLDKLLDVINMMEKNADIAINGSFVLIYDLHLPEEL